MLGKVSRSSKRLISFIAFSKISKLINPGNSPQTNSFLFLLIFTESTPQSLTALNINGRTFVFNLLLLAFPQRATIPFGFV